MPKTQLLGLLAILSLLAAGTLWFLTGHGEGPGALPAIANAPATDPAAPLAGAKATTAAATPEAPVRTEVPAADRKASPTGPALIGQVLDDTGRPLAGARVLATGGLDMPRGGRNGFDPATFDLGELDLTALAERLRGELNQRVAAVTDADGRFRVVPPGEARQVGLRIVARGYLVLDRRAARPTTADVDLGQLPLRPGAVLSGRVLDRQDRPVAGARVARRAGVELQPGFALELDFPGADLLENLRDGEGGVTDADGRFELAHVEPGEFALRARHPEHPVAQLDGLRATPGQALRDLTIVVEPGAVIRGKVLDLPEGMKGLRVHAAIQQTGKAEPGLLGMLGDVGDLLADVGLPIGERSAAITDGQEFELRGLQAGKSYRLWMARGDGACSEPKQAAADSTGVELRYDPGIRVTCQVVAAGTGSPVERLWVRSRLQGGGGLQDLVGNFMQAGGMRERTYPEGRVTLGNLRPKQGQAQSPTLQITIEALGFAALQRDKIVLPTRGDLDLGVLELRQAPVLRVTVLAADTGKPVADVPVRLQPQRDPSRSGQMQLPDRGGPGQGRTDDQGQCVLNALPGGTATLRVDSPAHAPHAQTLTMPAAEDTALQVRLLRGGSVAVLVRGADGKPLAKASVEHAPPEGGRSTNQTDAEGRTEFRRLAPGTHKFRLSERRGGGVDLGELGARFGVRGAGAAANEVGWQVVAVTDGAAASLELTKALTASLRGVVRENGVPLADARITFQEGPGSANEANQDSPEQRVAAALGEMGRGGRGRNARSAEDGSYALQELPAGAHRLRVTHKDRQMPTVVRVELRFGENVLDLDLDRTALRGTVRDPKGLPVANATVSVRRAGQGGGAEDPLAALTQGMGGIDLGALGGSRASVRTDADGRYEVRGVDAGVPLQVSATAKGFARAVSAGFAVVPGTTREGVDLQLGAAGSIQVQAQGAGMFTGVRATCVQADGTPEPGVPPVLQVLRRGAVTLEGLRPGRWQVEIVGQGGPIGAAKFADVVAGEAVSLKF